MTRHPDAPPASHPASRAAASPLAPAGPPVSFRNLYPRYPGYTPRRDGGLGAYESVLGRAGFAPVAGIDEAGRVTWLQRRARLRYARRMARRVAPARRMVRRVAPARRRAARRDTTTRPPSA